MKEDQDNIRFWSTQGGKKPVQEYLDYVESKDPVAHAKLRAYIQKLNEKRSAIIDGYAIKQLHTKCIHPLLRIKCKQYRIYTMLTPRFLFLLLGEDKKTNSLPKKTEHLIVRRAKKIIQTCHEL